MIILENDETFCRLWEGGGRFEHRDGGGEKDQNYHWEILDGRKVQAA